MNQRRKKYYELQLIRLRREVSAIEKILEASSESRAIANNEQSESFCNYIPHCKFQDKKGNKCLALENCYYKQKI